MIRFITVLTAAMLCGPFAANAAVTSNPMPINTGTSAAHSDAAYQVARLDGQVMNLNSEVQTLLQQSDSGTAYVSELSGVIPTGG
jgi:hypothetical protein